MDILNKIQRELKAPKGQKNNFGGYKYRSCEDILEAVKPLLGDAILTLSDDLVELGGDALMEVAHYNDKNGLPQIVKVGGSKIYVKATATITHNGESVFANGFAREADNKKGMDDAQITGSASSYARKYALNGLFLIDDTKDSDATNEHDKSGDPRIVKQQELIKLIGDDIKLAAAIKEKLNITHTVSEMTIIELDKMIAKAKEQ